MIREDTKKRERKQIYLQFLSASAEYLAASKIRKAGEKTKFTLVFSPWAEGAYITGHLQELRKSYANVASVTPMILSE